MRRELGNEANTYHTFVFTLSQDAPKQPLHIEEIQNCPFLASLESPPHTHTHMHNVHILHHSTSSPLHSSQVYSVASEDEEGPNLLLNCDRLSKDLSSYKDKIRGIVNDWMAHYRHNIGISLPTHLALTLPLSSSSSLLSRSVSAQGRRIQSSKSYAGMEQSCFLAFPTSSL